MDKKRVVIIGGGLGGLQCGCILAKNGYNVTIVEQNKLLGGYIQSYKRGKHILDTGFHYIGALDEGKPLNKIFGYLGLLDLPWLRLDNDIADEVIIGDKSYYYASGIEKFGESLKKQLGEFHEEIDEYCRLLNEVKQQIVPSLRRNDPSELFSSEYYTTPAYQYLKNKIKDPLLIEILSGASLKMELDPEKLPLYIFAQVNSAFIQSGWRIKGGGQQIAERLSENIKNNGGMVITGCKVKDLLDKDGVVTAARLENGSIIDGDFFISNAHPSNTLDLVKENKLIRNLYRKRVKNLANTGGMFTVSLLLKEESIKYQNYNIYKHKEKSSWDNSFSDKKNGVSSVMVSFLPPEDDSEYTRIVDILTPMQMSEIEEWKDTSLFKRGKDYEKFKLDKAYECIDFISDRLPGLKDSIEKIYTSTPLTYRDYCGIEDGSAYGIRKDCNNLMLTMLTPKTPIPNLFMTGQSLMIHGVLGVSMTAIMTCSELLDKENQIGRAHV